MAKQTINIGASPNDGTGTPLRTAFDYTNQNFTELYTATGPSGNNIVVPGNATITGDLTVRTDKLAVRSNGVGIGTTSPTPYSGYTTLAILGGANGGVIDINTSGGVTAGGMQIASTATSTIFDVSGPSGGAAASIFFRTGAYGALGERYRIDGTGQSTWSVAGTTAMTLNSNGLGVGVVPSAGKGALQLSSGINFPATQVASSDANTLDDYEEGTWTPTVVGATTAGVGTYSGQVGRYTKVGNLVTVHAYLAWTAHTGTGGMRFGGLPFTTSSDANSNCSVAFGYVQNVTLTAANIMTAFTSVSNTLIDCYQTPTGGGASTTVPIDTDAIVLFSVTYRV